MGWLRLVGSLKLYVSLGNIGLFCRALLQKRPILLRSLLMVATPYLLDIRTRAQSTLYYEKRGSSLLNLLHEITIELRVHFTTEKGAYKAPLCHNR